jgi:aryl carrier-like protein
VQEEISIDKIIPCLPAQHGFLVDSDAGNSDIYKQQITILVDHTANLSPGALEDGIRKIHKKCDILRTVFDWSTGKELQVILSGIPPRISFLSGDVEKLKEVANTELVKLDTIRDEPPIRFLIATVSDELYLTITYHHILLDGPSVTMLLDSIISSSDSGLKKDSTSDYLQWMDDNITDNDRQFWKRALTTLPDEDVNIFGDARSDPTEHSTERFLSEYTTTTLLRLAKQYKVSVATLMQALCSEWLVGYFGKPLVYGSVLSTREFRVNDDCLGPFINTVPVQISSGNGPDLESIARHTQEQSLSMLKAKHVPLRDIAEMVPSRSLFFDIILTITTTPVQGNRNLYKVIWTRENTGFPLSIDISVAKLIGLTFTSTLNQKDFDVTDAIKSFAEYCREKAKSQKEPIPIQAYAPRNTKRVLQKSINPNLLIEQVAQVLNVEVETINPKKSFLLNGGDSILALKLKNELAVKGLNIAVGQIIRKDSLLELTEEVIYDDTDKPVSTSAINHPQCTPSSISYILEAYKNGHGYDYHEQAAFCVDGNLRVDVLRKAVSKLEDKVTSPKLAYSLEGEFTFRYDKGRYIEFHHISDRQQDFNSFVDHVSNHDIQRVFNPKSGSLLRVYAYSTDNSWYLFISFSALVTDGWSFSILLERLFIIYSNLLNNTQVMLEADNLLAALPLMATAKTGSIPQKSLSQNKIVSYTFTLGKEEHDLIRKMAARNHITLSQYFEKIAISLAEQLTIETVLVYESGRDIAIDVTSTIGPFSYLRRVDVPLLSRSMRPESLYYVYENYPRESEDRLREDRVAEFNERGVWRRPLLPPTATVGVVVDIIDEACSIDILIRKGDEGKEEATNKRINKIIELIRERLLDE